MKRFLWRLMQLLLLGLITFGFVWACNQNDNQTPTQSEQSAKNCRVMRHALGETCVPIRAKRFVALNPAALGNAISLGIQPIGSVFEYDRQFPDYLKGKTEGIEPLGEWAQPSIERIALLNPDVIISWKHNHQAIYPQLSAIAPTVLYNWIGNNKERDNWKEYFSFVAKVLDREDTEKQVWQNYNERIEQLKTALGSRYKDKKIAFVMFCCNSIFSEPVNSFIGSIFSDAGLQLVEALKYNSTGSVSLSEETLDLIDGDVIFIMAYSKNDTGERDLSILQQKPLWKKLKAVEQNRVYYVDTTIWRSRTPLGADAVIDDLYKYLVNTP